MNCQKGDLAVIISEIEFPELVGIIFTCTELVRNVHDILCWRLPDPITVTSNRRQVTVIAISDAYCKPLRGKPQAVKHDTLEVA